MPIPSAAPAANAIALSNQRAHAHEDTVIDIDAFASCQQDQAARTPARHAYRSQSMELSNLPRGGRSSVPGRTTSTAPPCCSASMKLGIASAVTGLGACALLAHSIKRTLDSPPLAPVQDYCKGAIECGTPDPNNLVIEYVGAAILGVLSAFGGGAASMCRDRNGS